MAHEALEDTLVTLRERGYHPQVIQNKHIKVRWFDGSIGPEERFTLVMSLTAHDRNFQLIKNRGELRRLLKQCA